MIKTWIRKVFCPIEDMPVWEFSARMLWITIQLLAAYCLARPGNPFFYQNF
jgi:hypothetical protein